MTELLKLSDYFQPLNANILLYFLALLLFLDSLGTFIKKFIISDQKSENTRIVNWLIGLGFFIFIWFCLRFFTPPRQSSIILTIILISAITLPSYFKNGEPKKILFAIWRLKVPILIISAFLPAVFVKASLPPYYADEMAYQFLAPWASCLDIIG